jgi:RNA polymerase sigma-70 factor, ECF subfamily
LPSEVFGRLCVLRFMRSGSTLCDALRHWFNRRNERLTGRRPRSHTKRDPVERRAQLAATDSTLAERVSRGDVAAFETLYDRYAREVFVLAAHVLGRNDADEVVQDVFLKLWQRAGQFDPARGSFTAWLMTIARHRVFDQLKDRRSAVAVAVAIDGLLENVPDPELEPDELVSLAERRATMLAAVRELPAEQRRALVLAYFGGLSQSAISELLGVPLGTVKKRLRLGLAKLRASLSEPRRVKDRERPTASHQEA